MEDEYHVLFECPTYHHIRLKYEEALFSNFGGVSRAARSMRPSGQVSAFMNQNPRKVAAFVSECLDRQLITQSGGWVQVIKAGESDATRKAGSVMQC